jgi:hypothetical protein
MVVGHLANRCPIDQHGSERAEDVGAGLLKSSDCPQHFYRVRGQIWHPCPDVGPDADVLAALPDHNRLVKHPKIQALSPQRVAGRGHGRTRHHDRPGRQALGSTGDGTVTAGSILRKSMRRLNHMLPIPAIAMDGRFPSPRCW